MISLPQFVPGPSHLEFASESWYLRPSRIPKLFACPMSVFLSREDESSSPAADTGSLVHEGAAAFHTTQGDAQFRREAGEEALQSSFPKHPYANLAKATAIYTAYATDPENIEAEVVWCEKQVRLDLAPALDDPTGKPIVIVGTLDQVRRKDGKLKVWDIKTGEAKDGNETLDEYVLQQCAYVLAARQTLDPGILPGGFIHTPGYAKPRGRRHIDLPLSVDDCLLFLAPLPRFVSLIRQGVPLFLPSAGACQYCPVRPFKNCIAMYKGVHT